jgi:aspartyl-tRNA synthetase
MAFVGKEQVMDLIERFIKYLWNYVLPGSVDESLLFPRMTYGDAMLKYGSDKPDLRLAR